jgi:hypothetical protein
VAKTALSISESGGGQRGYGGEKLCQRSLAADEKIIKRPRNAA